MTQPDSGASPRLYARHQRYAREERMRHSNQKQAFLNQQSARLIAGASGAVPQQSVTVVTGAFATRITATSHPFKMGEGPVHFIGAAPAGFAISTDYWISVYDANTIRLATSLEAVQLGQFIAATSTVGNPFILVRDVSAPGASGASGAPGGVFDLLYDNTAAQIKAATNVDHLN